MFESFFSGLFSPGFAANAANSMDPSALLSQLGMGGSFMPGLAAPTGEAPMSFGSMLGYPGMPMPDSIMPWAGSGGGVLDKLNLDPKSLMALQQAQQQANQKPDRMPAPSAPLVSPRNSVSISPLVPPESPGTPRRNPTGVSLGQLLFGR